VSRRVMREEPALTNGNGHPPPKPPIARMGPARHAIAGMVAPAPGPGRRAEAPSLSPGPAQAGGGPGRTGWLSDLLTRASREDGGTAPDTARGGSGGGDRSSIDSLDSLAVDIARMIDHEA